jgi:hypothetical protein
MPLKRKKRKEVRPQLDGLWKVPMEGGQSKVLSLVAFERRRKNILFTSSHFPL